MSRRYIRTGRVLQQLINYFKYVQLGDLLRTIDKNDKCDNNANDESGFSGC